MDPWPTRASRWAAPASAIPAPRAVPARERGPSQPQPARLPRCSAQGCRRLLQHTPQHAPWARPPNSGCGTSCAGCPAAPSPCLKKPSLASAAAQLCLALPPLGTLLGRPEDGMCPVLHTMLSHSTARANQQGRACRHSRMYGTSRLARRWQLGVSGWLRAESHGLTGLLPNVTCAFGVQRTAACDVAGHDAPVTVIGGARTGGEPPQHTSLGRGRKARVPACARLVSGGGLVAGVAAGLVKNGARHGVVVRLPARQRAVLAGGGPHCGRTAWQGRSACHPVLCFAACGTVRALWRTQETGWAEHG